MGGIPWRWLFGAVLAISVTAVWIAPEPVAERMAAAPTRQLIEYLADERDNIWRAAADEILKRGAISVPVCTAAIPAAAVEHRLRLFYVLEQEFLSSEPSTAELAAESLEEFQRGVRLDLSMPADRILNENAALRTSRALVRVQELGGIYRPLDPDRSFESASAGMVLLDHHWQGGNVGLVHLVRIRGLSQLHFGPGARLTLAAIADLLHRLPRTHVVYEGQGCLGIEGEVSEFGFRVKGVGQDSPAARCGIQPDDVVVGCDDFAKSPSTPVALRVSRYAPGHVIRLHVRRARTRFSVNVELGDAF
ncbi:MAG: hypothetical protein Q7U75_05065, partial [Desulfobacterales bacterium]|nr:hypothetical protein [Desulfobacterales bacterium]